MPPRSTSGTPRPDVIAVSGDLWGEIQARIAERDFVDSRTILRPGEEAAFHRLDAEGRHPDESNRVSRQRAALAIIEALQDSGAIALEAEEGRRTKRFAVQHAIPEPIRPRAAHEYTPKPPEERRVLGRFMGNKMVRKVVQVAGESGHALGHYGSVTGESAEKLMAKADPAQRRRTQAQEAEAAAAKQKRKQWEDNRRTKLEFRANEEELDAAHRPVEVIEESRFNPSFIRELLYLDKVIEKEVNKAGLLPRDERQQLMVDVSDRVIRTYLGDEASDDDIDNWKRQLSRLISQRR